MASAVTLFDLAVRAAMGLGADDGAVRIVHFTAPAGGLTIGGLAVVLSGAAMWWAARRSGAPRLVVLAGPVLLLLMAWNCFEIGYRVPVDLGPLVGGILLVVAGAAPLTVAGTLVRRSPLPTGTRSCGTGDEPRGGRTPHVGRSTRLQRSHEAAVVRAPLPSRSTRPDRIWMERLGTPDGGVPAPRAGQVRQRSR